MAKINKKVGKKNKNIPHLTIGIAAVVIAILLTLTVTDRMPSSRNGDDVPSVSLVEPEGSDVTTDTEDGLVDDKEPKETGTSTGDTDTSDTSSGTSDGDDTPDQTTEDEPVEDVEDEPIEDAKVCTSEDTDGGIKLFEKGFCTAADGSTKSDFCASDDFVFEVGLVQENCDALCVGNKYKCDNGCEDGACLPEPNCEFTDTEEGVDNEVFGTCTGSDGKEYADVCLDGDTLKEYWPAEGVCDWPCTGAIIDCDNGCSDGACLPDPNKECKDFCTAIAKKDPYVDGLCVDRHGNTASITCNAEGYTYETPIPRKCGTTDACCCVGELTVI
ncbi:hypothetical protein HOA91_02560 [Candidatus Woesearchaeota archaeon]|jgi:hypothetical protein|nr:hypothetical protein [Candidatus Woesearchaeota archaeon]